MNKKLKRKLHKQEKKWAKQRAKRGYADIDVWNQYDWFIHTTRKMLKQLKKEHVGFPAEVLSVANRNRLASGSEKEKKYYSDKGSREWEDILDRMIFLLYEMDEDKCSQTNEFAEQYHEIMAHKHPEQINGYQELKTNFINREKEIAAYMEKSKNEFFRLYSKWFYYIWD